MKKSYTILGLLLALVFFFSCEPSRAENGDLLNGINPPGENGGTSSRLLKKINSHALDDNGQWEDQEAVFNYSGSKVISYSDDSGVTNFEYNSNNKISKIVNDGQVSTLEYTNGAVSKMTTKMAGGVANITSTYTYAGGKLSKAVSIQEYSVPLPVKTYLETTYQFSGENMVKMVSRGGTYLPDGTLVMNPLPIILEISYDDKNSAYKLLPQEFALYMAGIAPQGAAFLSASNMVKVKTTNDDNTEELVSYTHTYDSENYVVTTTGDDKSSIKYTYQ
ncbi:MAG: hypothetical protein BGO40_08255 [Chryseobacterium sp. 39-10]|nr:hypothetical protein [Chryseobacterium sp.]OJV45996.1 MAG: hypothetical protein BGO40_08255 [Chryseobacterium sp. 39-10]